MPFIIDKEKWANLLGEEINDEDIINVNFVSSAKQ